jgi:hypothetical protein
MTHSRLPLVGDRSRDLVRLANPKMKTFLREKNSAGLSASRASRWSALEPHNIIGKETQRPITSRRLQAHPSMRICSRAGPLH